MKSIKRLICLTLSLITLLTSINVFGASRVMIQNVPLINQHPELPTGCEATALTMLLQYHGYKITKQQVAKDLPKASRPTVKNGRLYGESPEKAFLGDPFSKSGFGVFSPVILKMVENYLPGRAENLGGGSFDKIYEALDQGRPVMIWTPIGMVAPVENSRWTTPEGKTVIWKTPEHAVVAVGYDETYIYINDPYSGTQKKYKKELVKTRWEQMGKQAVAIKPLPIKEEKPKIIEIRDAVIDGTSYKSLVALDEKGEWLPIRTLEGLHGGTSIDYNPNTSEVSLIIKENYPIPSNISKWLSRDTQGKQEAIPRNVNGKYYNMIKLDPNENEVITYNSKGKKTTMLYQVIDGTTYVNKNWVEAFYGYTIETTKNLQ